MPTLLRLLAVAAVYVLAAWPALAPVAPGGWVPLVWMPGGASLAVLLLGGVRLWPGIAAGALVTTLHTGLPLSAALGVAGARTLEPLVAAVLLGRLAGFEPRLGRVRDVAALALGGAAFSTAVSATAGVAALLASGVASGDEARSLWFQWWMAHALGDLVVAPFVLVWGTGTGGRGKQRAVTGARALASGAVAAAVVIALGSGSAAGRLASLGHYLAIPLALAITLWLGQLGGTTVTLLVAVEEMWSVRYWAHALGDGAGHAPPVETQAFLVALALATLGLAAVERGRQEVARQLAERTAHMDAIRAVTRELAHQVDLGELSALIVRQARTLTGADVSAIYLYDEPPRTIAPVAWTGFGDWMREVKLALGEGVTGFVIATRQGMHVADYRRHPRASPLFLERSRIVDLLVEPLVHQERAVGAILVAHESADRVFSKGDGEILALFADAATVAVVAAQAVAHRTRNSEQRYRMLAENVRDVIWTMDLDLRTTYASPSVEMLRGYSPDEAKEQRIEQILAPASHDVALRAMAEVMAAESGPVCPGPWSRTLELELTRKDGSTVWTETTVTPLRDAGGRLEGVLGVTRDVDARKRAEVALEASERRLQLVVQATHDAVWDWDVAHCSVWWSEGVRTLFGYTPAAAGHEAPWWHDRVHEEDRPRVLASLESALATGVALWRQEYRFRRADGGYVHVLNRGLIVRDERGAAVRMVGAMVDLSERRALEEQVRLQAAALEAAANAIVITTPDGTIQWVNPAFEALTGYAASDVVGQTPRVLKSGRAPEETYRGLWETIVAGRSWRGQLVNRRKDGTLYTEEQTITPVLDPRGEITAFVGIKQDVTERLRAEEELALQRKAAQQREKLTEIGQLLAGVAHELNNPLSIVLGHTALLRESPRGQVVGARAERISEAAQRCARIVKNFLALARQYPSERQHVSLNAAVIEVLELVAYALRVETVEVALDLDPTVPAVWADPDQVKQVLVNLLTNSRQALRGRPHPRRLEIATRSDPSRAWVILEVSDTGPGLPEMVRDRLFQPFVTTKAVGEGTGLGLSICKGIVEAHGGQIAAENRTCGGTAVRVVLPAEAAREADGTPPAADLAAGPLTVLVVDDEPEIVAFLQEMLEADGHTVFTAGNGATALQRLMAQPLGAVICDLKMPTMDGQELYEIVRDELPHMVRRIVFVTGDTLDVRSREFLAGARRPVLSKPFDLDDVRRALREVASGAGNG